MKELYQNAQMDVISFSMEDVIATSIETQPSTFMPPTVDDDTTDVLDPIP